MLLRIETYFAPAWVPGADEVTARSGVDDDGDDWGPAPAGTEDPVGHDAFAHQITLLHIASCRTFGVPRIYAELRRPGRWVNRKRITRVMRECDI